MFVRIIRRESDNPVIDNLLECRSIEIRNSMGGEEAVNLDVVGSGWAKTYELLKRETEIYVMNDSGKTIESHRWT